MQWDWDDAIDLRHLRVEAGHQRHPTPKRPSQRADAIVFQQPNQFPQRRFVGGKGSQVIKGALGIAAIAA
jgi:hypothetical protein